MQNLGPFSPCVLREMPRNPKFYPFHLVKIAPKLEKSTDHGQKLISSEDGQDTSACKISGQSLYAFSYKCPETFSDGRTDGQTDDGRRDGQTCCKMVTVGRVDQRTHVQVKRGYFRLRTDGRTDGQPENIMPQAPKGGGIKIFFLILQISSTPLVLWLSHTISGLAIITCF